MDRELKDEKAKIMEKILGSSGFTNWKCRICSTIMKKKPLLRDLVEIHMKNYVFKCPHCRITQNQGKNLWNHIHKRHNDENVLLKQELISKSLVRIEC